MAILWKPTGSLDINTAPTDLEEQTGQGGIVSGAMTRCKNLRLDRHGIAETRYGSTLLTSFTPTSAVELLIEVGGHRYEFAGDEIYYDETALAEAGACAAPTYSPDGGSYLVAQTVTISSATTAASIYYTINGDTPDASSIPYTSPISVALNTWLKSIAIDTRGYLTNSGVTSEYYSLKSQDSLLTEGGDTLTTENGDTLTTEGT